MAQSLDKLVKQGEGAQDAVDVGDGIFMSKNIANSYLVTTPDGDVLINTGTDFEADGIKGRFARGQQRPPEHVTFTQGHPDHVGGWDCSTNRASKRSRRPTTVTCGSTGGTCIRSMPGAS